MKKIKYYYSALLPVILLAISSCTRTIDLKLNNATGQLVIEGNITNIYGPQYVLLSKNVAFTNTNTYPPVSGATVTISDQSGNSYLLSEGPAGTYSVNNLAGVPGVTYTLRVTVNGQTYTANSTMPSPVVLDSIESQNEPVVKNGQKQITASFQDPAAVANQYLFWEYVDGVQVDAIFAFDDQFTNGKYVTNVLRENAIGIFPGDTVTVQMQCIDKPNYTYWFTLQGEESTQEAPQTAAPANPSTNITPATLGYFSAHTTQTKTLVVN